jgi:hypothetical protein
MLCNAGMENVQEQHHRHQMQERSPESAAIGKRKDKQSKAQSLYLHTSLSQLRLNQILILRTNQPI